MKNQRPFLARYCNPDDRHSWRCGSVQDLEGFLFRIYLPRYQTCLMHPIYICLRRENDGVAALVTRRCQHLSSVRASVVWTRSRTECLAAEGRQQATANAGGVDCCHGGLHDVVLRTGPGSWIADGDAMWALDDAGLDAVEQHSRCNMGCHGPRQRCRCRCWTTIRC